MIIKLLEHISEELQERCEDNEIMRSVIKDFMDIEILKFRIDEKIEAKCDLIRKYGNE